MSGRRRPVWLLVSAAWLGPAALAGLRNYLQGRLGGEPPAWDAIAFDFGDWFLCALFTPAVFAFARWRPLARGRLPARVPLHVGASLIFCVLWSGLGLAWGSLLHARWWSPYGMGAVGWLLTTLPFGVAVYFSVLGVEHATFWFVAARDRETRAARLEAQLADARHAALRAQLQPHFLLNSLNAVTVIVRDRDTATATRMLEQLGDLLRRVLRSDRPPEVPLAEELEFVREYLAIEQVRFADRLRPVFDADPAVLRAAVPELLLQPLVENAVRHGLARRAEATMVTVAARREGDDLVLSVTDDGPGPEAAGEGVGLANTRERLAALYGGRARLELVRTPSGGAAAVVRLPYREMEAGRG